MRHVIIGFIFIALLSPPSLAKTTSLYKWGFESSLSNWKAVYYDGNTGKVNKSSLKLTNMPKTVKKGRSALIAKYEVRPGHLFAMFRKVKIKKKYNNLYFKFWIRSERTAQFLVHIKERDKSEYLALVELDSVRKWEKVSLKLSDFELDKNAKNNTDENAHLDSEQIEAISLVDFTGLLSRKTTKTAVQIDDFRILGKK